MPHREAVPSIAWLVNHASGICSLKCPAGLRQENDGPGIAGLQGSTGSGKDTGPEGPDSIPKFGSMGGIDAKTGAPPASIHESSIGDISSGAKQNFPQDPISHGIGSGSATHGAHGASPYGGEGLAPLQTGNYS